MRSRLLRAIPIAAAAAAAGAAVLVLTGCVPSGPPSVGQVAGEFDDAIEPAWTADIPGIYGDVTIVDGLVAVYAQDDETGMRLEVLDATTGESVWKHAASPGGAWGAPLFSETDSPSRRYPLPPISPFVAVRGDGEDARPVVVYTERLLTETNELLNSDVLHVADLRSGEDLALTAPDFAGYETPYGEAELDDDGNVLVQAYSPYRLCGDGPTVCTEDTNGGFYRIDLGTLEVTNSEPEFDAYDSGFSRDFGAEYLQILPLDDETGEEGFLIGRFTDGELAWSVRERDLFPDGGGAAEKRDFRMVGDLLLIQGYRSITTNLDTNVFTYDYAASRTLVALDPATGELVWRADGTDSLCFAVDDHPLPDEPGVIPVCHATAGSFEYDGVAQQLVDEQPVAASIAGLNLSDGTFTWEVDHAGDQALLDHGRMIDAVFSSGPAFAVADLAAAGDDRPDIAVLDLSTGESGELPEKPGFLCEAERPGVQLEFQGSVFVSGSNPIALEYPSGWYQFPCDQDAAPATAWTKGAVRVGGIPVDDTHVVVVTEEGLSGFAL